MINASKNEKVNLLDIIGKYNIRRAKTFFEIVVPQNIKEEFSLLGKKLVWKNDKDMEKLQNKEENIGKLKYITMPITSNNSKSYRMYFFL